jgi:hypothetical protein
MSFSTYPSRRAAAERLLARDARDPETAAMHTAAAERADIRNHLVMRHANEHLAPAGDKRPQPVESKRADRPLVRLRGSIHLPNGLRFPVTVTDVSEEGCKVASNHLLPIGEIVQLAIQGRALVPVSIRWAILGKAGLRFISPTIKPSGPPTE